MPNVIAIVPAAGSGTRMGGETPKVLLPLGDSTVIQKTLSVLKSIDLISEIVLVVPEGIKEQFANFGCSVTTGGATRTESVSNGLKAVRDKISDWEDTYMLIHDGARCMVTRELASRCINGAIEHGAVTAAVPVKDTIREMGEDSDVSQTLDRSKLWAVQTPQVFRADLIYRAHEEHEGDATDDASLVEKIHPIKVVPGDESNFKLTTSQDMLLAKLLVG